KATRDEGSLPSTGFSSSTTAVARRCPAAPHRCSPSATAPSAAARGRNSPTSSHCQAWVLNSDRTRRPSGPSLSSDAPGDALITATIRHGPKNTTPGQPSGSPLRTIHAPSTTNTSETSTSPYLVSPPGLSTSSCSLMLYVRSSLHGVWSSL